jgi:hypothetical protein
LNSFPILTFILDITGLFIEQLTLTDTGYSRAERVFPSIPTFIFLVVVIVEVMCVASTVIALGLGVGVEGSSYKNGSVSGVFPSSI